MHQVEKKKTGAAEGRRMLRRGGTSTSIVSGGRRKVHTTFEDGREMVEEFDVVTDELVLRKVRQGKTALGREGSWVYEVGDEPVKAAAFGVDGPMLMESGSNVRIKREKLPTRNHRKRRVPVFAPDIGIATDGNVCASSWEWECERAIP